MKKQIRQGVFETNSSSTHSITISESNDSSLMDTLFVDEDGIVEVEGGEFGWEEETYNDAATKAGYMMIYAKDWSGEKSEQYQELLKKVIQEQTGCKEVRFVDNGDKYHPYGYIDHQSVEDRNYDYVFETHGSLHNFIFNKASVLTTDNDNH